MNIKKYVGFTGSALLAPFVVFAAEKGLGGIVETVSGLIKAIVPVVIAAAVLFFFFGLAKFMMTAGEDKEKAKGQMIWGIIILFVMVSVWGLVNLLRETVGVESSDISITNPVDVIK